MEQVTLSIKNRNGHREITNVFTKMNTIGDVKNRFYEKYQGQVNFIFHPLVTSLQKEWVKSHHRVLKVEWNDLLLGEMDFLWAEPDAEFSIRYFPTIAPL